MRDQNEQALAYVYFGDDPGRRFAVRLLSKDETRRIAANIARLPELQDAEENQDELIESTPVKAKNLA